MSMLEEAQAEQVKHGPQCSVAIMLAGAGDDAEEITELIDAKEGGGYAVYGSTAANILKRNGYTATADSINRHRKRGTAQGCACPF